MAFDEDGFALGHEVFAGNIAEGNTLMNALDRLMIEGEGGRPVVILDAGFASEKNLALLESRGFSVKIHTP